MTIEYEILLQEWDDEISSMKPEEVVGVGRANVEGVVVGKKQRREALKNIKAAQTFANKYRYSRATQDEYTEAIEAAMSNPVITRVTRAVPPDQPGTEFDPVEFKKQVRVFAPEMREVMQAMFEVPQTVDAN